MLNLPCWDGSPPDPWTPPADPWDIDGSIDLDPPDFSSNIEWTFLRVKTAAQTTAANIATCRFVRLDAPSITAATAKTVTDAATLYIEGPPAAAGSATITNPWALWVDSGNTRLEGNLVQPTGASLVLHNLADETTNYEKATVGWSSNVFSAVVSKGGSGTLRAASLTAAGFTITQGALATGSPAAFTVTGAAHTTLTASTEATDVDINLARTVQFATGALTTQRAVRIQAPTYNFAGASALATAATLAISGAPAAGGNATITNAYALWVQAGKTSLDGDVTINQAASTSTQANALNVIQGALNAAATPAEALNVIGAAHGGTTPIAASVEAAAICFDLQATVTFATGALTTQRAAYFEAPTYAFADASTITNAATLAIVNAPQPGNNAAITNAYALWIQAGASEFDGRVTIAQPASATTLLAALSVTQGALNAAATPTQAFIVTGAAHGGTTPIAASTEAQDINFALGRTVTFAAGALTTQRAVYIGAPTYAFAGASTVTTAATLAISGAPAAGTNATISNAYALWVQTGTSEFDGQITIAQPASSSTLTAALAVTQGALNAAATPTSALTIAGAAHGGTTPIAASVEAQDIYINLNRTVTFATGALTTQRACYVAAPTYAFAGASTITTAATLAIAAAPTAGTNATITNPYALWTQAGLCCHQYDGIGATYDVAGLLLANTTDAALNAQQFSPALRLQGQGFATNTSTSNACYWEIQVAPAQGAAAPAANLVFNVKIGSGAWTAGAVYISSSGNLACTGTMVTGDGAAAGPGWRFGQDTNTGIYRITTDTIGLALGGVLAFSAAPSAFAFTQAVATSGSPVAFTITGAAHTTLTLSTEAIDVNVNLNRTVQFATGALTTQRAFVIQAPTYAFVGASTITSAATFYVSGAPALGSNCSITNNYAIWADAGLCRFDGNGTNVFELPADATDPTGGGGAAAGRIPVSIGGATKYLAYY